MSQGTSRIGERVAQRDSGAGQSWSGALRCRCSFLQPAESVAESVIIGIRGCYGYRAMQVILLAGIGWHELHCRGSRGAVTRRLWGTVVIVTIDSNRSSVSL